MPNAETNVQEFFDTYDRLAEDGKCDGAGGMEYERVLSEWRCLGCPGAGKTGSIEQFIVCRANALEDGRGRERFN